MSVRGCCVLCLGVERLGQVELGGVKHSSDQPFLFGLDATGLPRPVVIGLLRPDVVAVQNFIKLLQDLRDSRLSEHARDGCVVDESAMRAHLVALVLELTDGYGRGAL